MSDLDKFKEEILKDYPRLKPDDRFRFSCHMQVECFNKCCADVNILLTPYDVLRMKRRLGLPSGEFLDRYTLLPIGPKQKLPIPILKMDDSEEKRCIFVDMDKGCTLYEDRPWPCRMYPLGQASPDETSQEREFFFVIKDDICLGHQSDKEWTVLGWMDDQGVAEYNEMGEIFKEITLHPKIQHGDPLEPKKTDMYFMACYDLDRFRHFVFDTTFLDRFEVDEETKEKLLNDDVELLRFGFRWLKFCLFGEKTLAVRKEVADKVLATYSVDQPEN